MHSHKPSYSVRRKLACALALSAGAAVIGFGEPAHALPLLTVSGSVRGLYGSAVGDPPVSAYGVGVGLRGGVTVPSSLYLGASFDYFFGESEDILGADVSTSLTQIMGHAGYDLGLGPLTLRPGLGLGIATISVDAAGAETSESDFVASPGVEGIIGLGLLSVSAEARYNKIFADGDGDAVVLGVGVGFSL